MENGLIVVTQLPVIQEQLAAVKESIIQRVNDAVALVCTEDNYRDVKKVRADLNKEYTELETRRKEIKAEIMAPYEEFEKVYKDCAGDLYKDADLKLKKKIAEVEDGLKKQKEEKLIAYFNEYQRSVDVPFELVAYEDARFKVGLSDSLTALKKNAKSFLDHIAEDMKAIESHEDRDEILTEYKNGYCLAAAMSTVAARHKAIEEAKRQREEAEARRRQQEEQQAALAAAIAAQAEALNVAQAAQEAALAAPQVVENVESVPAVEPAVVASVAEKMYSTTFKVYGTIDMLKALKNFLNEGGYRYEQQ
jgi:hypothetical protein